MTNPDRSSSKHRRPARVVMATLALAATAVLGVAPTASAQDDSAAVQANPAIDGPQYPIDDFVLKYVRDHPMHVPASDLGGIRVTLTRTSEGYIAPRPGLPTVTMTLDEIAARETEYYFGSAIQRVLELVRDALVERQYLGVYVAPDPFQINEIGQDIRDQDQDNLALLITTGILTEMRTIASGDRIDPEERINSPLHQSILDDSPIRPFDRELQMQDQRADLLRRDLLDDYVFFKSRHQGRRVDMGVAAAVEPGTVALDYFVTENKPLTFYLQLSNTGTATTGHLRERIGLFHTQLTNNDDVFSVDFSTASLDDTNSVNVSYERPWFDCDRLRWSIFGTWSEYSADDVGFFGEDFSGESFIFGTEWKWNFWQRREQFLDLVAGVRYLDVEVDNGIAGTGEEGFFIGHVGVAYERSTEYSDTRGSIRLEFQDGDFSGVDMAELALLGRTSPDEDWTVIRWDGRHSVFLEPLLNFDAWSDPSTPESSTLAHELLFRVSGQFTLGNDRLIPQAQGVAGGLYTVRGYPEAVAAGDQVYIGSMEYRYHIPRDLDVELEPRALFGEPFRFAPQYAFGRPDWDLVVKGFVDIGRVEKNAALNFETDETLIGAGIGIEFLYKRNVNVRIDWGFALDELESGLAGRGDERLHFVASFLF